MLRRLAVAGAALPVLLWTIMAYEPRESRLAVLPALVLAALGRALWEWWKLVDLRPAVYRACSAAGVLGLPGAVFLRGWFRSDLLLEGVLTVAAGILVAAMVRCAGADSKDRIREELRMAAWAFLGAAYLGGLGSYLAALAQGWGPIWEPPHLLLWTVGVTWVGDSAAYFAGVGFGRRHVFGAVSPGKTLEGAVAGLVAPGALTFLLVYTAAWPLAAGAWRLAALAVWVSAAGILGDLTESLIKRAHGVKDSSGLLPGHGGMLDKLDSLLFAAPAAYYGLRWL